MTIMTSDISPIIVPGRFNGVSGGNSGACRRSAAVGRPRSEQTDE